ncbi:MAG: FKBP-type peptidyl-prolyl cis-trans isomerase [Prevotellaceae bacterium]|jgi:FKBP-type peptidyl-prolyl cis-trans isomerase|nr:FKBP-type peptidyl-prolyl cis-trans isomerase [Prevotellaceae bacterium]
MTSNKTKTFIFCCLSLFIFSICSFCAKEDEKNQLTRQEKDIDEFIKRDTAQARRANKDTLIKVINRPQANVIVWNPLSDDTVENDKDQTVDQSVESGDTVAFYYRGQVFSSSKSGNLFADDFSRNVVGRGYYIQGLDAGLIGLHKGEHAYIIFTSKYGYGNRELSLIPKMSPLMFEVLITDVVKKK